MDIKCDYTINSDAARQNNPLLPKDIRMLLVGKSNCGKTTVLFNFLLRAGWIDYTTLSVFGNSLHQPVYKVLKKGYESGLSKDQISNLFTNQIALKKNKLTPLTAIDEYTKQHGIQSIKIKTNFYSSSDDIPDPATLNETDKNLMILDDCFLGPQNKAESYYTRGRHNNCDVIYITQNYFRLPRHTIRENANFIILFPQDVKNLNHIYSDHCSFDMDLDEFKQFCHRVWDGDDDGVSGDGGHNFVTIDLSSSKLNGRYRKNLDTFYFPKS